MLILNKMNSNIGAFRLKFDGKYFTEDSFLTLIIGNVTLNLDFEYEDQIFTYSGCGTTFMDTFWYFGGNYYKNFARQVSFF